MLVTVVVVVLLARHGDKVVLWLHSAYRAHGGGEMDLDKQLSVGVKVMSKVRALGCAAMGSMFVSRQISEQSQETTTPESTVDEPVS